MEYKRADRRDYLKPVDTSDIWGDDQTGNLYVFADYLEHQIVRDNDNYVLCINGTWGTGKTFFIKRWEASLEEKGYDVIYFNAWENDCGEDPLVSLATLIYKKIDTEDEDLKNSFKNAIGAMALFAGKSILRGVVTKLLGNHVSEEIAQRTGDILENGIDAFLEKNRSVIGNELIENSNKKVAFTKEFKDTLTEVVSKILTKTEKPLVLFIDELDRCRPTYAIEVLERIKHLFEVYGLKIVIACDIVQLSESVKSIYGSNFNALGYLQRFFDNIRDLKNFLFHGLITNHKYRYSNWSGLFDSLNSFHKIMIFSARDIEKIKEELIVQSQAFNTRLEYFPLVLFLICLKIKRRDLFDELQNANKENLYSFGIKLTDELGIDRNSDPVLIDVATRFHLNMNYAYDVNKITQGNTSDYSVSSVLNTFKS